MLLDRVETISQELSGILDEIENLKQDIEEDLKS